MPIFVFAVLALVGVAVSVVVMRYLRRISAPLAAGIVVAQPVLVVAMGFAELATGRQLIVARAVAYLVATEVLYALIWAAMLVPYMVMVGARTTFLRRVRKVLLVLTSAAWAFWLWITPIYPIFDVTGVCLSPATEYTLAGDGEVRVECDLPPG